MEKKILIRIAIAIIGLSVFSASVSAAACNASDNGILEVEWTYNLEGGSSIFGSSAGIADLGVNNNGTEPDADLEIVVGGDSTITPWRAFDSQGNVEWATPTQSDEPRGSPAIIDIDGDGKPEVISGTTSGETVEVMYAENGSFKWTFPSPPHAGNFFYYSSPAVADVDTSVSGLEVIIGNRPHGMLLALDGDNSDNFDDGITLNTSAYFGMFWNGSAMVQCNNETCGIEGVDWDVLWVFNASCQVKSTPAIGDIDKDGALEVVFGEGDEETPCNNGSIYALDAASGTLEWSYQTRGSVPGSAGLADFDGDGDLEIVIGSGDGNVYFIDGDENNNGIIDANEVTSFQTNCSVYSSPAIGDVDDSGDYEVVIGNGQWDYNMTNATCTGGNSTYSFDYDPTSNTATLNWITPTGGAVYSSPALADRNDIDAYDKDWPFFRHDVRRTGFYGTAQSTCGLGIYVTSDDGYLYLLKGSDGSVIDRFNTCKNYSWWNIHTSPIVADVDGDKKLNIFFYDFGWPSTFWNIEDKSSEVKPKIIKPPKYIVEENPYDICVCEKAVHAVDTQNPWGWWLAQPCVCPKRDRTFWFEDVCTANKAWGYYWAFTWHNLCVNFPEIASGNPWPMNTTTILELENETIEIV